MVKDKKFDYKMNIALGVLFFLGAVIYFIMSLNSGSTSNWIKAGCSFAVSVSWFLIAYNNYKKSKNV
ncbi:MAG: hypothetical protein Q8942_20255 [Bacillota bacterium]|nr:hypothetical protein [Bacillota bacterium]